MIAATTAWFDENRGLAVSLVSAGMGVAPMTISPFARWLISTYEWRPAMLIIGVAAWVLLVPAALLVRRPPAETADTGTEFAADGARPQLSKVFRSPQFIVLWPDLSQLAAQHIPGRSSTW